MSPTLTPTIFVCYELAILKLSQTRHRQVLFVDYSDPQRWQEEVAVPEANPLHRQTSKTKPNLCPALRV